MTPATWDCLAAGRHSVVDDSVIADIDTRAYKIRESVVDRSFSREFLPIRGDEDRFVLHVGTGDEHTRFSVECEIDSEWF